MNITWGRGNIRNENDHGRIEALKHRLAESELVRDLVNILRGYDLYTVRGATLMNDGTEPRHYAVQVNACLGFPEYVVSVSEADSTAPLVTGRIEKFACANYSPNPSNFRTMPARE